MENGWFGSFGNYYPLVLGKVKKYSMLTEAEIRMQTLKLRKKFLLHASGPNSWDGWWLDFCLQSVASGWGDAPDYDS